MLLNAYQLNAQEVNGDLSSDGEMSLLVIEEATQLLKTGVGSLVQIAQSVKRIFSGNIIAIEEDVISTATNTFYSRNGWEPIITLGGLTVGSNILTGSIVVNKQAEDNFTSEFTIILRAGTYNLYNYQGKSVTINVKKNNIVYRVFTGVVDIPILDEINEKLTLRCVADRRSLLSTLGYLEPYIGLYSPVILGDIQDTYERITARLSTTPQNLDFDSYNVASINSWTPKGTADYSYGSLQIYRREPTLQIESAAKIINKININFDYGYQRCHHREINYTWAHTYAPTSPSTGEGGICSFLQKRPTMPTRELIRTAINSAGWPVRNDVAFGKQFKSGTYRCSGVWVSWSTVETGYINAPIVDSNGNPVLGANGNQLMRAEETIVQDNTNLYTMNADWIATTRFKQNIKETYAITVQAPNSVSVYGTLANTETFNYTDTNQYNEWEQYTAYKSAPSDQTLLPNSTDQNYFFNVTTDRVTATNAINCALQKARTAILKSHRDTRISFEKDLTPELELKHTVALTGKWVTGKGKADKITHIMNISETSNGAAGEAYTKIELLQYRGVGTIAESSFIAPTPPSDVPTLTQPAIALQTHLGIDPSSSGSENWTGYVGNLAITETLPGGKINRTRTNYQESFIINTPAIQPEFRDDRILPTTASYNVDIPTDTTAYTSYG